MRARIALNALALQPAGSGVQTYIRELVRALAGRIDADLTVALQAGCEDQLPGGVALVRHPPSAGARRALACVRSIGAADVVHGLDVDSRSGRRRRRSSPSTTSPSSTCPSTERQ